MHNDVNLSALTMVSSPNENSATQPWLYPSTRCQCTEIKECEACISHLHRDNDELEDSVTVESITIKSHCLNHSKYRKGCMPCKRLNRVYMQWYLHAYRDW